VFTVSTALRGAVLELSPSTKTTVAPNFVPTRRLERAQALRGERDRLRRELQLDSTDVVAVSVATRLGAKGQVSLVDELARAVRLLPALRLVLVGRDADGVGERLRGRAAATSCSHALRLTGWRDDVLEVVAAGDVLVHAPTTEGLGRVIQEAMAASIPVVSYSVEGVVDLVEDGRTGALAPAGDVGALVDLVLDVARDPVAASRMGAAGHERVRRDFSPQAVLAAHYECYDRLARAHDRA
jgi:glycosyltransferase involved in cell wall biosynthesis